jgi:hypothetical protein
VRLARNASSVQGAAWSADSRSVLFLATDEQSALRLWSRPAGWRTGHADTRIQGLGALGGARLRLTGRSVPLHVCGWTHPGAGRIPAQAGLHAAGTPAAPRRAWRFPVAPHPPSGVILADAVDSQSSAWALPIDAESGAVRGPLAPSSNRGSMTTILPIQPGWRVVPLGFSGKAPSCRITGPGRGPIIAGSARSQFRRSLCPSSERTNGFRAQTPEISRVLNLKTGESWGRCCRAACLGSFARRPMDAVGQHGGSPRDHGLGYQNLRASARSMRIPARTCTWPVSRTTGAGRSSRPRSAAASRTCGPRPFADCRSVPVTEWVDLGEGDYPRWSPAGGRIYFTQVHDGFECIFTRAVDPGPSGPWAR